MASFDSARPSVDGRSTVRPTGFFGQMVGICAAWNDARVTRNALSRLSDHELDDLGLSRGDVDAITRRTNY
ncbi:DUF1127 domain-containing protein [Pseudoruegeria sp. HB172150]|uniref:DUF1127 domain-containing protein n=1 Tax=Pseudoruegeria sp. HB172150 TaxID=2721164 RepID=UPI001556CFEC|nr:DUF1127 domain-containing protein [Pseudoruegeria sp. HB172150]